MSNLKLARMTADFALLVARRRAAAYIPFSPAWDAAMRAVEDCEREAYRVDQAFVERAAQTSNSVTSAMGG